MTSKSLVYLPLFIFKMHQAYDNRAVYRTYDCICRRLAINQSCTRGDSLTDCRQTTVAAKL